MKTQLSTLHLILSLAVCISLFTRSDMQAQQTITFEELGLSFEISDGWTGQLVEEYYVLGHTTIAGLMILSQNPSRDAHALTVLAEQGIVDEGVNLQPTGSLELIGDKRVEGYYQGPFDGTDVKCFAIGLINGSGQGINIMILTTPDQFGESQVNAAKDLAASVSFFEAVQSSETVRWKNKISGYQLKYMYTSGGSDYSGGYSGTSDVTIIKLYMDDSFYYYSNSHSSFSAGDGMGGESGFGYANNNASDQGTYSFYTLGNKTYLELKFDNGEVYEYALSTNEEGQTFLNGSRYFVVDINHE